MFVVYQFDPAGSKFTSLGKRCATRKEMNLERRRIAAIRGVTSRSYDTNGNLVASDWQKDQSVPV